MINDICSKLSIICSHEAFKMRGSEVIPKSWLKLLDKLKQSPWTTLNGAKEAWTEIRSADTLSDADESVSTTEIDVLKKLTEFVSSPNMRTVPKNTSHRSRKARQSGDKISTKVDTSADLLFKPPVVDRKDKGLVSKSKNEERSPKSEHFQILEFFTHLGDILWFKDNEDLRDVVVTEPMSLVRALRTVISHKVVENFDVKVKFGKARALLEKGMILERDFKQMYQQREFSHGQIWGFLRQLDLGFTLQSAEKDELLFLPCIISDRNEHKIKSKAMDMWSSPNSICVEYTFDNDTHTIAHTIGLYSKMLKVITETFLHKEWRGDIAAAFSQKLESRRLGNVAGILGHLFWSSDTKSEPIKFDFLVLEREFSMDPNICFAVHRGIRILLKPTHSQLSAAVFEILQQVDSQFSTFLVGLDVQRTLFCKSCQIQTGPVETKLGHFKLDEGMKLQCPGGYCSNLDSPHELDPRLSVPGHLGGGMTKEMFEKAVMKAIIKPSDPGKNQ